MTLPISLNYNTIQNLTLEGPSHFYKQISPRGGRVGGGGGQTDTSSPFPMISHVKGEQRLKFGRD